MLRRHPGVLLGAWLVANIAAYRLLVRSGWPSGGDAPEELRVDLFDQLAPSVRIAVIALAFVVPVVLVPLWRSLERLARIDSEMVTEAYRWSVSSLRTPTSIAVLAVVILLLTLPAADADLWFLAAIPLLLMLALPFGIFNARLVTSAVGEAWWKPRWPGLQPFAAMALVGAMVIAADLGLAVLEERVPALRPLPSLLAVVITIAGLALEGTILLFRLTPREALARGIEALSWRRLGAIVGAHARLAFAAAFVFAPVAAGALVLWKLLPVHAAWAESRGAELPLLARALAAAGSVLETSGGWIASFVLTVTLLLMVSRVLWSTRATA